MPWTTDEIVTRARMRAQWPSNAKLTDTQILLCADEELQSFVAPQVRAASAGFWLKETSVALVDGTFRYAVPSRASIGSVYEIDLVYGSVTAPTRVVHLPQVDRSQRYLLGYDGTQTGTPSAFTVEDDSIVVFPTPAPGVSDQVSLRVRYERRPSQLVATSSCALITSVSGQNLRSATSVGGGCSSLLDIVKARPPFTAIADSVSVSPAGTGPYTYAVPSTSSMSTVVAGDYICPENQTCVSPVPDIWYWFLIDRTTAKMLDIAGDASLASTVRDESDRKLAKALTVAGRRVKTAPAVIMPIGSPLRSPTVAR